MTKRKTRAEQALHHIARLNAKGVAWTMADLAREMKASRGTVHGVINALRADGRVVLKQMQLTVQVPVVVEASR